MRDTPLSNCERDFLLKAIQEKKVGDPEHLVITVWWMIHSYVCMVADPFLCVYGGGSIPMCVWWMIHFYVFMLDCSISMCLWWVLHCYMFFFIIIILTAFGWKADVRLQKHKDNIRNRLWMLLCGIGQDEVNDSHHTIY